MTDEFNKLSLEKRKIAILMEDEQNRKKQTKYGFMMSTLLFILDLFFDLTYMTIVNIQRVIFNYLGGVVVVFVQMVGFYFTQMVPEPEI